VLTADRDYADIYRSVAPNLWRAVYVYAGGNREIADDAVAEAFARAIQNDGTIRKPASWLYRCAFRIAAAEIRLANTERTLPDRVYEQTHGTVELFCALRKLSPSQRVTVYLHYEVDMPVREIASYTGMSIAAVKVHLHRGRRRLRELLGTEEADHA
jgi:RNA polymerase sigma-70 factor (ECF subfamily)